MSRDSRFEELEREVNDWEESRRSHGPADGVRIAAAIPHREGDEPPTVQLERSTRELVIHGRVAAALGSRS